MTTKEQERQALEKIRKIVESLGEYSYIGMAMDGVLEDAERNIEDDAAYSMKQRYGSAEKRLCSMKELAENQTREINTLKGQVKIHKEAAEEAQRRLEENRKRNEAEAMPKWCAEMILKHLEEKEDGITDELGMVADQMASYSLGLCGQESDETKDRYKQRLKDQALKHRQLKTDLAGILETERHFQAYLKTL